MKEDKLGDLSMQLSVDILKLVKELRSKHETIISNQIGRSATSICANIAESKYAHGLPILLLNLKSHLKNVTKQVSGLKCFSKVILLTKLCIIH